MDKKYIALNGHEIFQGKALCIHPARKSLQKNMEKPRFMTVKNHYFCAKLVGWVSTHHEPCARCRRDVFGGATSTQGLLAIREKGLKNLSSG